MAGVLPITTNPMCWIGQGEGWALPGMTILVYCVAGGTIWR